MLKISDNGKSYQKQWILNESFDIFLKEFVFFELGTNIKGW